MSRELAVALTPEQWGMVSVNRKWVYGALRRLRMATGSSEWLDAEQAATVALEKAVATYDAGQCCSLRTYAGRCIHRALIDQSRADYRRYVSLESLPERPSPQQDLLDVAALNDTRANIRRIVGLLPSRERAVLWMYFGLDGDPPMTCREIAWLLGRSKGGVELILRRGLLFVKGVLLA